MALNKVNMFSKLIALHDDYILRVKRTTSICTITISIQGVRLSVIINVINKS